MGTTLSGGEQQMLAIARVLVGNQSLLHPHRGVNRLSEMTKVSKPQPVPAARDNLRRVRFLLVA